MTLFSSATDAQSHRTRIVLFEKDVSMDVVTVDPLDTPEDLRDLNPYNSVPTLVDRDLVLYDSKVIIEYLDERFPHPPLMPVDPVSRARTRLALFRVENDWYSLAEQLERLAPNDAAQPRKMLHDSLVASAEAFAVKPFFLSDEFSMVDVAISPILWRLEKWGIQIPREATAVEKYAERMFSRASFRQSLTEAEIEMR